MTLLKAVGVITARGGSKSIPRKNLAEVAGRPLIAWTIEAARAATRLERIIVSTEDAEIAEVARTWGAEVPFYRPTALAADVTAQIDVLLHCLDWLEQESTLPSHVFLLQPTSPLRTAADIDAAIALAEERAADAVIGVVRMDRHPCLAMRVGADGRMSSYGQAERPYLRRQDVAEAFAVNGAVYVHRSDCLRRERTFFPENMVAYIMPPERSVDVDGAFGRFVAEQVLLGRGGAR